MRRRSPTADPPDRESADVAPEPPIATAVQGITGPRQGTSEDIPAINALFSEAFTERYHRDGMPGVRVPRLNPAVWTYALRSAGPGALVWSDRSGALAAFNLAHGSGREGWMGPLAVRGDLQGLGLGRRIVEAGIAWLQSVGASVVGLETMPRTVDNIGFYSQLGFRPKGLTVTLAREVGSPRDAGPAPPGTHTLAGQDLVTRARWIDACDRLTATLRPGVAFAREMALTLELGLGDVGIVLTDRAGGRGEGEGEVAGFALWHTAPIAITRRVEEIRVLKLAAIDRSHLGRVLRLAEHAASQAGGSRLLVRCQSADAEAYGTLIAQGYRVHWTDLRMTLEGYEEPGGSGIVWSNWEI